MYYAATAPGRCKFPAPVARALEPHKPFLHVHVQRVLGSAPPMLSIHALLLPQPPIPAGLECEGRPGYVVEPYQYAYANGIPCGVDARDWCADLNTAFQQCDANPACAGVNPSFGSTPTVGADMSHAPLSACGVLGSHTSPKQASRPHGIQQCASCMGPSDHSFGPHPAAVLLTEGCLEWVRLGICC